MSSSDPRAPHNTSPTTSGNPVHPAQPASFFAAFLRALLHPPKVSRGRYILAMSVALIADLLFWWLGELLPVASDFVVAVILALCLGGLRLEILIAFLCEATPGFGLLPSWSLAVPIVWMRANASAAAPEASTHASAEHAAPTTAALPPAETRIEASDATKPPSSNS